MREAALRRPVGWGEFSPFPEYEPAEASRWLASALESAARMARAAAHQDPGQRHGPRRPGRAGPGGPRPVRGCRTAKIKVAERGQSLHDDVSGWLRFATPWGRGPASGSTPMAPGTWTRRATRSRRSGIRAGVCGAAVRIGRGAARAALALGAQRCRCTRRGGRVDPQGGGPAPRARAEAADSSSSRSRRSAACAGPWRSSARAACPPSCPRRSTRRWAWRRGGLAAALPELPRAGWARWRSWRATSPSTGSFPGAASCRCAGGCRPRAPGEVGRARRPAGLVARSGAWLLGRARVRRLTTGRPRCGAIQSGS